MNKTDLKETARNLVSDSKGILAMDESFPTIKKRFEKLNFCLLYTSPSPRD